MPRFMHAGITCTCIFLSSAHKCPAHLSVIGGTKSSYVLGSELWESKFDGLLALVKGMGNHLVHTFYPLSKIQRLPAARHLGAANVLSL